MSKGSVLRVATTPEDKAHSPGTLVLDGTVTAANNDFLYAGAEYSPSFAYRAATEDVSRQSRILFRARGDGKTYTVTLYSRDKSPTTKYFVADRDWSEVTFPFSDFGVDGRKVRSNRI